MALTEVVRMPGADYQAICDAVRAKTGGTELLKSGEVAAQILGIQGGSGGGGGSAASVPWNDVTFIDYDGTVLHSYSLEEAQALTELPPLPTQPGLICQGWNWSLEDIKAQGKVTVGAMYITDDGKTRIYITLHEGRTSPMLGVCPNGTVTVDWGDGTEPDVLTGTSLSTVVWTPTHEYAEPGDYVISLSVDGSMGFYGLSTHRSGILRYGSGTDNRNTVYRTSVKKIEVGAGVTSLASRAFDSCTCLESISLPDTVTSINNYAFGYCPCLKSISVPKGVTSIGQYCFTNCTSLKSISIPVAAKTLSSDAFETCTSLEKISIPKSVASLSANLFKGCTSLKSIRIPDIITSIYGNAFTGCQSLGSIKFPNKIRTIGSGAFSGCYGVRYYDFSDFTSVPNLENTNAFTNISADCQMLIPSALYDEWSTATNWATYASYMVAV